MYYYITNMKNSHLMIQLAMIGVLMACVALPTLSENVDQLTSSDQDVDGGAMDKRYRLMGKRYRLMGKRYRLAGKRGGDEQEDSDENNSSSSELMKLFENSDSEHQADKRYRLMGKRYRLLNMRQQRQQPRHFDLNTDDEMKAEKRYRLMGKKSSAADQGEVIYDNEKSRGGDDGENSSSVNEEDLLKILAAEKRYRLMGKRYRLAGKRYRLAG